MPPKCFDDVRGRPHIGWIVGADVTGDQEPISPDASVHRNVLFAVRCLKGDRITNNSLAHFEARKKLAGSGIYRLEPAIERSIECHVPSGY